jgi:hypothetical protein
MQSKIDYFSKKLKSIEEGLEIMKKFGINERILIAWLCHEMKISEKQGRMIVEKIDEFYGLIIKKEVCDALEEQK